MAFGLDIAKIIKYEGTNNVLVWKHPSEDFNTSSQLIVHESQEADRKSTRLNSSHRN